MRPQKSPAGAPTPMAGLEIQTSSHTTMPKRDYRCYFMKLMFLGLETLESQIQKRQIKPAELRLLLWLGRQHLHDSYFINETQLELAKKRGMSESGFRNLMVKLRRLNWVDTYSDKMGRHLIIMNPDLFSFTGQVSITKAHAAKWEQLQKLKASSEEPDCPSERPVLTLVK
jgi:hypothetical protein